MEENKEKTTDELLKENNELLKTLIGKLGIIRTAAWIFVIGVVISVLVYLLIAINSCNGSKNSYNSSYDDSAWEDSVAVVDTTDIGTY